jgi:hypothetical protein
MASELEWTDGVFQGQECSGDLTRSRSGRLVRALCLGLLFGLGCKRPETALREQPVRQIELVQQVQGMTSTEENELVAQLSAGMGIPSGTPVLPEGPTRVFRLTLKGAPNPNVERTFTRTLLVSTGYGLLAGALLPALAWTHWETAKSALIATGVGGVLGFAYGPIWYKKNQSLQKELGYLPWTFTAEWTVIERRPGHPDKEVATSGQPVGPFGRVTPNLDLKPFLRPLPPDRRTEADVRQASLKAYGEAFLKHLQSQK